MANETLNIQNGVSPITIDTEVTEGSMRPVTSDGIYKAIQAGGGGGSSSSVLDVVCTVTGNGGVASYDYSVSAEDAVAAVNAGKVIRLTVFARGNFAEYGDVERYYSTVNVNAVTDIAFFIASGDTSAMPTALLKVFILDTLVPGWREGSSNDVKYDLIQSDNTARNYSVPQRTPDGYLRLDTIQEIIKLDGSVAQLAMGAMASAGTAIGVTINDPTTLEVLSNLQAMIVTYADHGKPCKLFDTYLGVTYGFDVISTAREDGTTYDYRLTAMTATAAWIVAGDLSHITLSFAFTYGNVDDDEVTQAQIAAYCDSHPITFM